MQPRAEISARRGGAFKRLSDAWYQNKLRKGLCFRCDENMALITGAIQNNSMFLLIAAAENDEDGGIEVTLDEIINTEMDQ